VAAKIEQLVAKVDSTAETQPRRNSTAKYS